MRVCVSALVKGIENNYASINELTTQVDNETHRHTETMLGISICKKYIYIVNICKHIHNKGIYI